MGEESCLGENVDCYCVDKIRIGSYVTVSQYSHLCTAGHDISKPGMPLVTASIKIANQAWVCAGTFIGPGVAVGEGAVTAARAVVVRGVAPWTVVGGNPARFIKIREIKAA
jgi:putative colanic acid biosynthesis acetyltransferase WcaF